MARGDVARKGSKRRRVKFSVLREVEVYPTVQNAHEVDSQMRLMKRGVVVLNHRNLHRCRIWGPSGEAFIDLMHFLSLMMVKTPKARRVAEHGVDCLNKLTLKQALKRPEQWAALQSQMRQAGTEPDESFTYEQMKEFVEHGRYTFKADQNWLLLAMMRGAEEVMPSLIGRTWSVLRSPEGGFISSDHPVAVSFTRPVPAMWSPAPGLPNTEVQCAFTRNVIIIGSPDGPAVAGELNRKGVARYNARALRHADRFVYSTEKDFVWLGAGIRNQKWAR